MTPPKPLYAVAYRTHWEKGQYARSRKSGIDPHHRTFEAAHREAMELEDGGWPFDSAVICVWHKGRWIEVIDEREECPT